MSAQTAPAPLAAANELFRDAYGGAQDGVRDQVPILVVLATELSLRHREGRKLVPYSRPVFERAKAAAHVAVALFAYTAAESNQAEARAGIARLLKHISAALDGSERSDANHEVDALLERCRTFANTACEKTPSEQVRAEFARDAGPRILRITELATCEQVAGLHEAVEATLGQLSADEQAALQVVVVGDHQARTRSLGMQYFKRRFREGDTDERVTYGENVDDEEEAILLVAKRRLDQRIARAFFGDEHRLQRDVLGDAAKRCLERMEFTP
ncbi:MAG TPA: hypothetical protein VHM25_23275 [Polyangiaceae bacterium]|jgi:hypothetical protein|nr:hypothetical protein [Polyangiaceae bacterium]